MSQAGNAAAKASRTELTLAGFFEPTATVSVRIRRTRESRPHSAGVSRHWARAGGLWINWYYPFFPLVRFTYSLTLQAAPYGIWRARSTLALAPRVSLHARFRACFVTSEVQSPSEDRSRHMNTQALFHSSLASRGPDFRLGGLVSSGFPSPMRLVGCQRSVLDSLLYPSCDLHRSVCVFHPCDGVACVPWPYCHLHFAGQDFGYPSRYLGFVRGPLSGPFGACACATVAASHLLSFACAFLARSGPCRAFRGSPLSQASASGAYED